MKIFHLPDLGEGLAEAEIREWYVKEGETVNVDQPLVSMETAKAVVDVPSPYSGKIIKLHGNVNSVIPTGAPLITFDSEDGEKIQAKNSVVGSLEESSQAWQEEQVVVGAAKSSGGSVKAMPAARVLAKELQINLSDVQASGPQGLITPDDVRRHVNKSKTETTSNVVQFTGEKLHGVRRIMAQTMLQSQQEVVPVTIIEDADITNLPAKADLTVKLIQAIIFAAQAEPNLNALFDGSKLTRKLCDFVNLGIAIDAPEGLFVPVIEHAEQLTPDDIRKTIDEYKSAVTARTIKADKLQGATISLSNFGSITGKYATPIIVPPTVAILGAGRTRLAPVIKNNEVAIGKLLPLSLTFDHRAVTGGEAARFLGKVIEGLQSE